MKPLYLAICLGLSASAQSVDFNVTFPADAKYKDMHIYVKPTGNPSPGSTVELTRTDAGNHAGRSESDPAGFYTIYCADTRSQYTLPVYITPGSGTATFEMSMSDLKPATSLTDAPNRALQAYTSLLTDKTISLNKDFASLSDGQVRGLLASYTSDADSIIASYPQLPADVADYIRLWSYVSASDACSMTHFLTRRSQRDLGFKPSDLLPDPATVLDRPLALYFPSSVRTIVSSIHGSTVEQRFETLYDTYTTPAIRKKASEALISSFLDNYNYSDGFDKGLQRLTAIVERYSLPASHIDTFQARRATISGAPFPDVQLVDREGNDVDFSSFRGKYVYVDLWASWCGPCCKEVPHLQKLEKEFEGTDIVFVSISIDSSRPAWLKKMDQLDMHGNQLWNSDESLARRLNVRGIPHFLIYDPQGNMHTYNALRPSNPKLPDILRSLINPT